MTDYHEFRRRALRKRRRRMLRRIALVVLAAVLLLGGGGFAAWRFLGGGAEQPGSSVPAPGSAAAQSTAQSVAQPTAVPQKGADGEPLVVDSALDADTGWNSLAYAGPRPGVTAHTQIDDGSTAMDYRIAGQPGNNGRVDMSFFDNTVFLGDSLSHGMQIYESGIPNAQYCVYTGAGPQAVVNGQAVPRASDKVKEIVLDALVAKSPDRIYILFGTNVLTRDTSYTSFIAYYSQMLDMIREALPTATIYIQSITPVRPNLRREKPGLYKDRLMRVNDELAALALQKGCYFVNIWEALADENGDLKAEIAQGDGYHVKPDGYAMWVEYLRTHTEYTPGVIYEPGTSYYIEQ